MGSIESTKSLRLVIEATACPACQQKTLKLNKYTTGTEGWEADVVCGNCRFSGTVNSHGFQFSKVDSKGKAIRETRK